jgi:hypothetical protein
VLLSDGPCVGTGVGSRDGIRVLPLRKPVGSLDSTVIVGVLESANKGDSVSSLSSGEYVDFVGKAGVMNGEGTTDDIRVG